VNPELVESEVDSLEITKTELKPVRPDTKILSGSTSALRSTSTHRDSIQFGRMFLDFVDPFFVLQIFMILHASISFVLRMKITCYQSRSNILILEELRWFYKEIFSL
jgi:hypothetical protein